MEILKIFRWTIFYSQLMLVTREMLAESIVVRHRKTQSLTMNVKKGATAELECNVTVTDQTTGDLPPHVIEWFHKGDPVFIKVGKHPPHVNPDFAGRISMPGGNVYDASLRIDNVREEDDGWYECRVLFLRDKFEKSSNGTWIKLVVTEPPKFIETPKPTVVSNQGDSLLLRCTANGRPTPVITWRKDTRIIRDGQNGIRLGGNELAVTSLNASHRGMYTCRAISVEGQTQYTTSVYVKAPPVISRKPEDTTAEEGQNAMFACKAEGYPTEITYRWSYNGIAVEESQDLRGRYSAADGTLLIDNVTPRDKGIVTCTADNGFGIAPFASASISVQFSARVSNMPALAYAGLGLKAILHCPSSAKPPVNTVEWKKNGISIFPQQNPRISLNENGSLIISSTNSGDNGGYTCTPYNNLGTLGESTATKLIIRDPPYFTYSPGRSYEAVIGDTLEIPCKGGGDPPPAMTWRKISSSPPGPKLDYSVFNGDLVIEAITKEYHGTWECVITNTVAEVTTKTQILVKYTSPHKVSNVTAQALSGKAVRVSWSPGYNGGYPQRFVIWYKPAHKGNNFWKTFYVEDYHTSAVVGQLEADTTYEFAVLPENALRSGPFSDTIATKTLLARSPTPEKDFVMLMPPQALFASKTNNGFLQLSWRKPKTSYTAKAQSKSVDDGESAPEPYAGSLYSQKIIGFLIEFRWISIDQPKGQESISERIAVRKHRSLTLNGAVQYKMKSSGSENFARQLMNHVTRSKRAVVSLAEKKVWKILTTIPDNVTTVVVSPKKVYRDVLYEFRVLAMSQHDYSMPSNPVRVSTRGLAAYLCFTANVNTSSVMGDGVVAGVVLGISFIVLACLFGILCFYRIRKKKMNQGFKSGHRVDKTEDALPNHTSEQQSNPHGNGISTTAKQPTVVDLTNGGPGGYGTMEKREFESLVDSDVKTPFIGDDIKRNKSFSCFGNESSNDDGPRDVKECVGSGSDRSSVRLRRQKAAQILFTQLKRRSMTEHLYPRGFQTRRDIHPLRGGIRSASTSPERTANISFSSPPDRLNVTSPAAMDMPRLRRKIRLYSRPIEDSDTGQHRKMIVIKRKSQRSSSSLTTERARSFPAPPSDSSESPVFGVIGTSVAYKSCSSPILSESPDKKSCQCSFPPQPISPVDNEVFSNCDCDDHYPHGDELKRNRPVWDSPITKPLLASSPKEPVDTSPNRVIARRTVAYDPPLEHPFRHRSNPNQNPLQLPSSSPERGMDWSHSERYNSLKTAKERVSPWRRPPEDNRACYDYVPEMNACVSPQQIPMSYAMDLASRARSPAGSAFVPRPRRYSLAQRPVAYHVPPQNAVYHHHPSTPVGCSFYPNDARTRASYSFGHHQPFTLHSRANVPESPLSPQCNISMQRSNPQPNSPACPPPLQSTLEIDCSNSDIEVRFVKDRNGNEFLVNPNLIDPYHDIVSREPMSRPTPYSNRVPQGYGRSSANPHQTMSPVPIMTPERNLPSLGNDVRCNQHNLSPANRPVESGTRRSPSTSPTKYTQPERNLLPIDTNYASSDTATLFHPVMMPHLLSPSRSTPTLPTRLKAKIGGATEQPTSPPLIAVGSSGYGSQDTSNSSASPSAQLNPLNVSTSPIHTRVFGLSQERPPRRDNSSVEDNYEWDSEIAMESEILEALRHFGTLKKSGPVSDELMDELSKFTKDTKNSELQSTPEERQRDSVETEERNESSTMRPSTSDLDHTKERMARRCAALRAEFLHYQQLQQLDENKHS